MTIDTVLASGCIPSVFQAIEIDGEHYWDGGYMGNPPFFPIIYNCSSTDVVLIMVNPIQIKQVPQTAQAILDRINTLSFNSSLMREMRAVNFINHLVDSGFNEGGRLKKILIHCIDAEDEMSNLGVSSKLNVGREFLRWLFELGRKQADDFLRDHFDKIGTEFVDGDRTALPLAIGGYVTPVLAVTSAPLGYIPSAVNGVLVEAGDGAVTHHAASILA